MSIRQSLFYSFLDRYASLAISVVSSMVIARLLTPNEIGVYSVTMVLLVFVSTVRDMGAGQYLLQEKELTNDRIRAVWAVQLGLGVGLALLVLLGSYPVAAFYNEPRMRDIMLVIAFNYAINPFGSLTYAWLMREMRFESVALMRFCSALGGAVVSVWMAWRGFGPISLAFGSLASTIINALMASYFRPKSFPWLPGVSEIRRVLVFGSQLTASTVIAVLAGSAPELLIGKLQSLTAAGLFSRANGLVQMFQRLFVDAVAAVCMPWFASQSREQGNFVAPFLKSTSYVTACGWSFCFAVIFLAHPMVRALYGNQWDQSVDLTRLLAIATACGVPASLCRTALLSSGAVSKIARISIYSAIQSVAWVALGSTQSLLVIGMAMIAASLMNTALWTHATAKHLDVSWWSLFRTLGRSLAVASMAAIGPALSFAVYGPYPDVYVMPLLLGGLGGALGFLAGLRLFRHPLQQEFDQIWSRITPRRA